MLVKKQYTRDAHGNSAPTGSDPGPGYTRRWRLSAFLAALILTLELPALPAQELIANPALPSAPVDRNQLRLYFTMRLKLWDSRIPLTVFVLPDHHPLHEQFAKSVLGLFPYQLRQVWDRQLFSGTGQAPITVNSEQDMIERVATTPGAIGYAASGVSHPQVQILEIR